MSGRNMAEVKRGQPGNAGQFAPDTRRASRVPTASPVGYAPVVSSAVSTNVDTSVQAAVAALETLRSTFVDYIDYKEAWENPSGIDVWQQRYLDGLVAARSDVLTPVQAEDAVETILATLAAHDDNRWGRPGSREYDPDEALTEITDCLVELGVTDRSVANATAYRMIADRLPLNR